MTSCCFFPRWRAAGITSILGIVLLSRTVAGGVEIPSEVPAAYRPLIEARLAEAGDRAGTWASTIREAPEAHRDAVCFLVAHMPEVDLLALDKTFVLRNVALAYKAREATPWARSVPEPLFFEQVLPHSSINERRDDWREDFLNRFLPIVKDARTAAEAVERLNVEVFKSLNVKYHPTRRPKPDQSPYESIEAGYASCTGLSILLIDACRAVGIPARFVGTPRWTTVRGNHSWVEVFTDSWRFVGACEPSRLDETWFLDNASKADETNPIHRIYATSYQNTGLHFPMVWNRGLTWVQAVDVTRSYTKRRSVSFRRAPGSGESLKLTLWRDGAIVGFTALGDDGRAELDLAADVAYRASLHDKDGRMLLDREIKVPDVATPIVELD